MSWYGKVGLRKPRAHMHLSFLRHARGTEYELWTSRIAAVVALSMAQTWYQRVRLHPPPSRYNTWWCRAQHQQHQGATQPR